MKGNITFQAAWKKVLHFYSRRMWDVKACGLSNVSNANVLMKRFFNKKMWRGLVMNTAEAKRVMVKNIKRS